MSNLSLWSLVWGAARVWTLSALPAGKLPVEAAAGLLAGGGVAGEAFSFINARQNDTQRAC